MVATQRKYICSFCARAFSRSEHRTRHERSHTGVKPFSCKVCSHSFVRRDLLQRHIRTVHRSVLLELQLQRGKGSDEGGVGSSGETVDVVQSSTSLPSKKDMKSVLSAFINDAGSGLTQELPSMRRSSSAGTITGALKNVIPQQFYGDVRKAVLGVMPQLRNYDAERIIGLVQAGLDYIAIQGLFVESVRGEFNSRVGGSRNNFESWCTRCPLLPTLACIGYCLTSDASDAIIVQLWGTNWDACANAASGERFLGLHLLVHMYLEDRRRLGVSPHNVSRLQQQTLELVLHNITAVCLEKDIWTVFCLFVNLMIRSNECSELSRMLYRWFLTQPLLDSNLATVLTEFTQKNPVTLEPFVSKVISHGLLCEVLMGDVSQTNFRCAELLHNTIIMASKCCTGNSGAFLSTIRERRLTDAPQKFLPLLKQYLSFNNSNEHWALLLATWFDFVRGVGWDSTKRHMLNGSYTLDGNFFYSGMLLLGYQEPVSKMSQFQLDLKFINNNLAMCTLPILCLLEENSSLHWLQDVQKRLIYDVLLFNLHLLGNLLFLRGRNVEEWHTEKALMMLENPIVQFLLFVWSRFSGNQSKSEIPSTSPYTEQFLSRYITNTKMRVDTDTLIKNDFDMILFLNADTNRDIFYGFHILLRQAMERIEHYLVQIMPSYVHMINPSLKSLVDATIKNSATIRYEMYLKISDTPSKRPPSSVWSHTPAFQERTPSFEKSPSTPSFEVAGRIILPRILSPPYQRKDIETPRLCNSNVLGAISYPVITPPAERKIHLPPPHYF
ncbi:HBL368Wp [Eremothecium sinecaudum]|uniref:HBL368Wp n=1 Tax=Eremothecium sinecaudum TaxID=45286 RepID=A0A109UW00_9SACH|nr:HBL368Wp [Eremothecium sinecaudum]AMD18534.1 HBL368Wp [Eremothecium sinecaudum]